MAKQHRAARRSGQWPVVSNGHGEQRRPARFDVPSHQTFPRSRAGNQAVVVRGSMPPGRLFDPRRPPATEGGAYKVGWRRDRSPCPRTANANSRTRPATWRVSPAPTYAMTIPGAANHRTVGQTTVPARW